MLTVQEVAERANRILEEVERAVVGKRDALALVLLGFLGDGHVLIEDFPVSRRLSPPARLLRFSTSNSRGSNSHRI